MIKIKPHTDKVKSTLTICPFYPGDASDRGLISGLQPGEWMLSEANGQNQLYFKLDKSWNPEKLSRAFRLMFFKTAHLRGKSSILDTDLAGDILKAALRGVLLSDYKSNPLIRQDPFTLYLKTGMDAEFIIRHAVIEAETRMWAMRVVDLPPNEKTPELMGSHARKLARDYGYECEVWNDEHMVKDGLNAVHAVGKGSANPPVFIICRYFGRPDSKEVDLALVGKGITFDTGGVSIKGSTNLHYMKSDMGGAAAVLGAITLAARLKLPLNIVTVVPAAENSVDGKSLLPGEVIQSYSGKTIEVIDTDAEGRLVLADGLAWVLKNHQPRILLDMATLTGSSVRTLGYEAAALYASDTTLGDVLYRCGQDSGERLWQMPLWPEYLSYIKSDVADIANLSLKPVAGSIIAAKFLEYFTQSHPKWAHIDMPGMAFGDSPFNTMKSATGYGVQLLADFMDKLAENPDIVENNR